MTNINLQGLENQRLVFYLALEDYLSTCICEDTLFVWQVKPTVIFGRNQLIENEVNVDYCLKNGIEFYRRKSGGGCVYSDPGNIMISYITNDRNVDAVFARYLEMVTSFLRGLGLRAVRSENNDILIDGLKVSGNAFHLTPNSSVVHGTLLYDMDFGEMENTLNPPVEKLNKRGIASVRQRVVNLKDIGLELSIEELKDRLIKFTCNKSVCLNAEQISKVIQIEREYLNPQFIQG